MTPALDAIRFRMEEAAEEITVRSGGHPHRAILRAFAAHLDRVADAARNIVKDLNHDTALSDKAVAEIAAIVGAPAVLAQAIAEAKQARIDLDFAIRNAEKA